jgi:hypothetical protein
VHLKGRKGKGGEGGKERTALREEWKMKGGRQMKEGK